MLFRVTTAFVVFLLPTFAYAALVNINTADSALLQTLPGIGPTYAGRIIDYRTANGPFAAIADIQNVSGIGPSTFSNIEALITVGDAVATTSTSTPAIARAQTYIPPPMSISIKVSADTQALVDVPVTVHASVTKPDGSIDASARIQWSFGDGSASEGTAATKTYRYPGTYRVVAVAQDGMATARGKLTITVTRASVVIASINGDGMTLKNNTSSDLDLSGWRLVSSKGTFRFPAGTTLLPQGEALFPFTVMQMPIVFDATLYYPDGALATLYAPGTSDATTAVQPSADPGSYKEVKRVETITNQRKLLQPYAEPVIAPAVATNTATAGAPLVPTAQEAAVAGAPIPAGNPLLSPWTLGLVGVIALAGGAFILL